MKAEAHFVFEYDIPDDENVRQQVYGTKDPKECVKIDEQNSPEDMLRCIADIGQLVNYTIELG